ncbi:hypothetical protein V5O48_001000 [Marasmius crinis-equi]|uniref:Protein PBN1 n=1 Tax=Marasmius crinis-equi TaxID=585013 RepID=A0ABR3G013_9AGAR
MTSPRLFTQVSQNGYHPTLTTVIFNWASQCSLHLLFTLPPLAFVDPYELETSYADQYAFHLIGHRGLELPVMAVDQVSSHLLLDMKIVEDARTTLEIPLPIHFRYGELSVSDVYEQVDIPWPKGFAACPSLNTSHYDPSHEGTTVHLPDEFQTVFSDHISLAPIGSLNGTRHETLRVPVGNPTHLTHVEVGTSFTVLACFLYLCWISWQTKLRLDEGDSTLRFRKSE